MAEKIDGIHGDIPMPAVKKEVEFLKKYPEDAGKVGASLDKDSDDDYNYMMGGCYY